jgi:hypothetical protein
MAYPTICETCLKGEHDKCLVSAQAVGKSYGYGGWFCVCAHGGPENEFQREVRERAESIMKGA